MAGGAAEAALVEAIGRDAARRPDLRRHLEGLAVITEPVQREDDRLDPALRQPFAQRQTGAVIGDELAVGEARRFARPAHQMRRRDAGEADLGVGRRRTAREQQQRCDERGPPPTPQRRRRLAGDNER